MGRQNRSDQSDYRAYEPWLNHADPAVVANVLICLIHQANYLPDRQIAGLERQFITEGGYSERLHAARLQEREKLKNQTDLSDRTDRSDKIRPKCGKIMLSRTARKGPRSGLQFWGCSGYPDCRATLEK